MFIDTNREPSNYQDDHYEDVKSEYSRLKQELEEIRENRQEHRECRTWSWPLEIEFRQEQKHLIEMIRDETGIH